MIDMVERVARAICPFIKTNVFKQPASPCDCEGNVLTPYGPGKIICYQLSEEIARAAIEAMQRFQDKETAILD